MRRREILVGAGLGVAGLAAPALRSAHAQAKTLVFGGSVPLTGAAAETGLNVNNGYITAVTYLNEVWAASRSPARSTSSSSSCSTTRAIPRAPPR